MCLFVTLKRVWISISYLSGNNLLIITVICLFVFFFLRPEVSQTFFLFFFCLAPLSLICTSQIYFMNIKYSGISLFKCEHEYVVSLLEPQSFL